MTRELLHSLVSCSAWLTYGERAIGTTPKRRRSPFSAGILDKCMENITAEESASSKSGPAVTQFNSWRR